MIQLTPVDAADLNQDDLRCVRGNTKKVRSIIFQKINGLSHDFRSHEPKFVQHALYTQFLQIHKHGKDSF